jgi:arylesterase/paraoxonase
MRYVLIAGLLLLAATAWFVFDLLRAGGAFKTIEPHFAGTCREIDGVTGAEDIVFDPVLGYAWISAQTRRIELSVLRPRGGIWGFDPATERGAPVELSQDYSGELHPHGIDLGDDGEGGRRLFVVNHPGKGHSIELFDVAVSSGRLAHVRTLEGPLLVAPNDVAAVGPESFYVTNSTGGETGWEADLVTWLRLPRGNVLYYDGATFRVVADRLAYANGVAVSRDGATVYVAETLTGRLHVYDRDAATGALAERAVIETGSGIDNISLDAAGRLWIGAHPKLLAFAAHAEDADARSPSQVLVVTPGAAGDARVEEVYLDDGRQLSGSAVAARWRDHLLIGPVFERHFLACRLPE